MRDGAGVGDVVVGAGGRWAHDCRRAPPWWYCDVLSTTCVRLSSQVCPQRVGLCAEYDGRGKPFAGGADAGHASSNRPREQRRVDAAGPRKWCVWASPSYWSWFTGVLALVLSCRHRRCCCCRRRSRCQCCCHMSTPTSDLCERCRAAQHAACYLSLRHPLL
jgi:hypothetical protein